VIALETGSTHPVTHAAFHPHAPLLAVAQPHHGATLFDRAAMRPTASLAVPRCGEVTAVAFCYGGAQVAVSSGRGTHLFDTRTGRPAEHYLGVSHAGAFLAERGGRVLAAGLTGVRELVPPHAWDGISPASKPLFWDVAITRVHALSPDGRWLVARVSRSGPPCLIDAAAGELRATIHHPAEEHDRVRLTAAFAANGSRFAVCDGTDVSVYDSPDPESEAAAPTPLVQRENAKPAAPKPRAVLRPVFRLPRPEGVRPDEYWAPPVAFTPDGRALLIRRPRNRVQLWDVDSGGHTGEWSWRYDGLQSLAVAPDGLTAVAGARFGRFVVWDLE
jgi:WD40 repeat protein